MKTIITIAELLHKIKIAKRNILSINNSLDPSTEEYKKSKLFLTLYNPSRGVTAKGIDIETYARETQSRYDSTVRAIKNLQILLMIKEKVNAESYININDLFTGKEINVSVAQVLVLKSPQVKNYYLNLINKIKDDISVAETVLNDHENTVLSHDNIDRYVIAKVNSMSTSSIDREDAKYGSYKEFAKEYTSANELKIYDPLNFVEEIDKIYENVINFYDTIDYKLLEFNAINKIWIDLDAQDGNYYGWNIESKGYSSSELD